MNSLLAHTYLLSNLQRAIYYSENTKRLHECRYEYTIDGL